MSRKTVSSVLKTIEPDVFCLTLRGPGKIPHRITKTDMVIIKELGLHAKFVLIVKVGK